MVGGLGFLFTLECMHVVTEYFNIKIFGAKKSAHCSWVMVIELVVGGGGGNHSISHSIAVPLYNLFDWKGQVPQTIFSKSPDCSKNYFLQNKCLSGHLIDILYHITQLTFNCFYAK